MAVDVDEVECADFIILACVILKKQDFLFAFWLFSSYAFCPIDFYQPKWHIWFSSSYSLQLSFGT